ncbi:hypothetical protein HYT04_03025 [Candidatus Kaiserbacteria bacterium]|nr:hypothetical protein [Candidatus Kaiserbacteria bacterium]
MEVVAGLESELRLEQRVDLKEDPFQDQLRCRPSEMAIERDARPDEGNDERFAEQFFQFLDQIERIEKTRSDLTIVISQK